MIWSVGPNPAARATSVSGGTRRTMVGMDVRDDGLYPALLEPGDHRPGGFGGDALALPGHADRPGDLGGAALVGNAACSMPTALPSPRRCTVQLRYAPRPCRRGDWPQAGRTGRATPPSWWGGCRGATYSRSSPNTSVSSSASSAMTGTSSAESSGCARDGGRGPGKSDCGPPRDALPGPSTTSLRRRRP